MKKIIASCLALILLAGANAQQKEGKVIYERTVQLQFSFNTGGGEAPPVSQTRSNKLEMNFANNQMILRQMEEEMQDDNINTGGMVIRTMGGGTDDATFCDFNKEWRVEAREFFDKKFLIGDTIRRSNWKLTEETKTILGHTCRQATSQRIAKRMMMSMENGKMERKEVDDTSTIVAWFTTDIPVPAGPEVQGQLPGLILELITNNGRTTFKALEIYTKPDLAAIKEPTKGKKVTPAEFTKERNKMMEEMQRNNQGGNFQIRMN